MKKILGTVLSVCVILTLAALSILSGGDPLTELQLSTLKILLIVCGASAAYCFIVGEITHNYSQMDKLWSLLPIAYLWIMAVRVDMLEVGRSMTAEEDKTHFGMWCAMNSPLLIGCDMTRIKDNTLKLLTNRDLIAINQDPVGEQAYVVNYVNDCYVLARDVDRAQGTHRVLVVYNPSDAERQVNVNFRDLCFDGRVSMRDLFGQKDLGRFANSYIVDVPAHGCRIYRLQGQKRLEQIRYEAETAYISDYQEIYNNQALKTGIYEVADGLSGYFKASWLGCSAKNDLRFRKVYSQRGGDYRLTIAYLCGENRSVDVEVNGELVKTLTVNSGNASTVKLTAPVTIHLKKGYNEIRLSNAKGWMPDIDYIEVVKGR